jgi:hypothetical protein
MSKATGPDLQNDVADTEVELSAEDLLALANPHATKSDAAPSLSQSMPIASARTREVGAPRLPTTRYPAGARMALTLVGAIVLVSAGYGLVAWQKATPSLAYTFEQKSPFLEFLSESASQAEAQPVQFTNPFDGKEVFEFSPGTTQDAAREAVAQILMERAMARQGS